MWCVRWWGVPSETFSYSLSTVVNGQSALQKARPTTVQLLPRFPQPSSRNLSNQQRRWRRRLASSRRTTIQVRCRENFASHLERQKTIIAWCRFLDHVFCPPFPQGGKNEPENDPASQELPVIASAAAYRLPHRNSIGARTLNSRVPCREAYTFGTLSTP